jgi:hypothetical protein
MFTIFSDAALAYFYEHDNEGTLSAKFSLDCAEIFRTLLLTSISRSSGQNTRGYGSV